MNVNCEILAPAGRLSDVNCLYEAGADAVYVGLKGFSSRPQSSDLSVKDIHEALEIARDYGKKLYVATNSSVDSDSLDKLYNDIHTLDDMGVDALIIADYGVLYRVSKFVKKAKIHLSTLTGVYNAENVKLLLNNNVERIILSSDLFLDEIQDIIDRFPQIEYEIVADGGVCFNSNRQCLLPHTGEFAEYSVFCQHSYDIFDNEKNLKQAFRIGNCPAKLHRTMGIYLGMGITSFKVEGRTNDIEYVLKRVREIKESKEFYLSNQSEIDGYMHYIRRKCSI